MACFSLIYASVAPKNHGMPAFSLFLLWSVFFRSLP